MNTTYQSETASPSGPGPHWGHRPPWAMHADGPPLPMKLLSVGVAFLIFKPLGIALGAYWLLKGRFHFGQMEGRWGGEGRRCGPGRRGGMRSSGNSAFDERRRETIMKLREEEKAFADFAEEQRRARDKEAFDRFMASKNVSQAPKETPDNGE